MSGNRYGEDPDSQRASNAGDGRSPLREAKGIASDLKNQAAGAAHDVTRQVKEQASQLTEKAKDAAAGATEKLRNTAENQKNAGADLVRGLAGALRRGAGEFDNQMPQAAEYIRRAAEQIDSASNALRQRNVSELLEGVQGFARRQPTAFLGLAALAGFAAVRFLKSSKASQTGGNRSQWAEEQSYPRPVANSETARRFQGAGSGMRQDQRM